MSEKRFKRMMEEREQELKCTKGFQPPIEICAIAIIAVSAIAWIGSIGVKKAGGRLPWE